jgi:hypothetical protein
MSQLWLRIGFIRFGLAMLALDLCVFHRDAPEVRLTEAAAWRVCSGCLSRSHVMAASPMSGTAPPG